MTDQNELDNTQSQPQLDPSLQPTINEETTEANDIDTTGYGEYDNVFLSRNLFLSIRWTN